MGKKIDKFILTSILAAGLFLYFEAAFHNRILAVLLAMLCCMTILKTLNLIIRLIERTGWQQRRVLRRKSDTALMHLACMDLEKAQAIVNQLLSSSYQNEAPVAFEPIHPSMQLSQEEIFNKWREFHCTDKLIICTTGKCSPEARIFASTLKSPRLAIVDGEILSQLIAEHPEVCFPSQSETRKRMLRLSHVTQLIFNRRNAPLGLLFSFSMLVMYVFSGNISYLFGSLFLLFTALFSFRRSIRPSKLF